MASITALHTTSYSSFLPPTFLMQQPGGGEGGRKEGGLMQYQTSQNTLMIFNQNTTNTYRNLLYLKYSLLVTILPNYYVTKALLIPSETNFTHRTHVSPIHIYTGLIDFNVNILLLFLSSIH